MESVKIKNEFNVVKKNVSVEELVPTLADMENKGFFGITQKWEDDRIEITAWEFKNEKCYETGRSATYSGPCIAVGDDDDHFIGGTIRVCEKTAKVYSSDAYKDYLTVSEPDAEMFARLEVDSIPFDCNTLARDAEDIANAIEYEKCKPEKTFLYTGPFKYICLKDGTIIRRGIPASISNKNCQVLLDAKYGITLEMSAPAASNFQDLYNKYGPIFLVENGGGKSNIRMPDFSNINDLSEKSIEEIVKMIINKKNYVMFQGTDPSVEGCCPLAEVGELNKQIKSGLFESWASPMSKGCPINAYSLVGEIGEIVDSMPVYTRNDLLRISLYHILTQKSNDNN